jgi:ATP-dependent Zn protease
VGAGDSGIRIPKLNPDVGRQALRKKKEKERRELAKQFELRKLTAFHEAGHVVIGERIGPGVEIVTIDPMRVKELTGQEFPGFTRYRESGPVEAKIVLCLTASGLTSEAMFVSGGVVNPNENDLARLNDLLENQLGLRGPEKEREFVRIRLMTQDLVSKYSTEINAVANALMERNTLTGEELQQILNQE